MANGRFYSVLAKIKIVLNPKAAASPLFGVHPNNENSHYLINFFFNY